MRHNQALVDALIGSESWRGEVHWFGAGAEPQVEVIRWMKQRLEDANVSESFLMDPYLGSEALKRVVLRQGNETVSLTLVISPGDVDPDAPELDVKSDPDHHVATIVATANELRHHLCGTIHIVHVRRGRGRRQAFHDRYFGLSDRSGIPRVFLLSNSLSKAAGDWPFAVVELDRVNSWIVNAYVRGLIGGNDHGRALVTEEVWSSTASGSPATGNQISPATLSGTDSLASFRQALWKTYLCLHELEQRGADVTQKEIDDPINELVAKWPATTEHPETLARLIVDGVGGREQHAASIADRLMPHPTLQPVASALDTLLVERLLERLAPADALPKSIGGTERVDLLRRAGQTIALGEKGTDFVRNRFNFPLHRYASAIEAARSNGIQLLFAGLGLVLVGLEVAFSAKDAAALHRIGLATDYIHFLGRFLRSWVSEELFGQPRDRTFPPPGEDIAREAVNLTKKLRAELGSDLDPALERLLTDSMLPDAFMMLLHGEPTNPIQNAKLSKTGE
jgi:hypothetical protein